MAGFLSDSDSQYGYDLTVSDEELLLSIVDNIAPVSPQTDKPISPPAVAATPTPARNGNAASFSSPVPFDPDLDPDASIAIDETVAAISDDDLSSDFSDFERNDPHSHGQRPVHDVARSSATKITDSRRLAPFVPRHQKHISSFVTKTKPRSLPSLLPGPDVSYPDLTRALSEAEKAAAEASARDTEQATDSSDQADDNRSPLLRFRTFPMKPFSVSDLLAGSWCELQYHYVLTKQGGRRTRTDAMKRGTDVHKKLEETIYTPVEIEVVKKEDVFGLKIWNIVQGLRVLRDEGMTRELEVWGVIDGNVVNGIIDGLSYENPDRELEEDVLSSRGSSSQTVPGASQFAGEPSNPSSMEEAYQVYISDVKTRTTATTPSKAQVRGSIIQLFLYHRLLSEMASDNLDYARVFQRYGLNLDEPFSDDFMAQIGAVHEEVFADADAASSTATANNAKGNSRSRYFNFPTDSDSDSGSDSNPHTLKYRSLRALLPLLKSELRLTFPRGAADLGNIVAVEYRYRSREPQQEEPQHQPPQDRPPPPSSSSTYSDTTATPPQAPKRQRGAAAREEGSVICVNTFFVEPEKLDLYLADTMRWWRGERPPRGVAPDEAFKCRSCEFADACDWRRAMDEGNLWRARKRLAEKLRRGGGSGDEGGREIEEVMTATAGREKGLLEQRFGGGGIEEAMGRRGRGKGKGRGMPEIEDGVVEVREGEVRGEGDGKNEKGGRRGRKKKVGGTSVARRT